MITVKKYREAAASYFKGWRSAHANEKAREDVALLKGIETLTKECEAMPYRSAPEDITLFYKTGVGGAGCCIIRGIYKEYPPVFSQTLEALLKL